MVERVRWGLDNPHPLSQLKTELVWEGKYDEYGNRRSVDIAGWAMPPQKIETIDEPASRTHAQGGLFDPAKAHTDDFRNMLIWGDNKLVMASLLKDFKGKIDLIYIDPPFDVGADFTMVVPIGDESETVIKDQSTLEMVAYRDMWGKGTDSYLYMIYERLTLMRELLSETGSIFVHCDTRMNSPIKLILDEVFGAENGVNEITWKRTNVHSHAAQGTEHFSRVQDTIHFYGKTQRRVWHQPYESHSEEYVAKSYKHLEEGTGRRFSLGDLTVTDGGPKGNPRFEFLGITRYWRYNKQKMEELYKENRIVQASVGSVPRQKRYLDESPGTEVGSLWTDILPIAAQSQERLGYATQKPEALLERIIRASSNEDELVADFFCGSGTTGAVAERLGRRWLMSDLGRFSIHTSRKRLIELQRNLHAANKCYRAFDVYNLGRYERQWWQKERLKGADEEHRNVVLGFYKAEVLPNPGAYLHGRKGRAFVFVDGIDSILTRDEVRAVASAARQAGSKEVHCLAWEFEMDLRLICIEVEASEGVQVKLIPIPREIMEKNRKEPPPFLEVAVLEAEAVLHSSKRDLTVDIKLTKFRPSLAEVPSKELEALRERTISSGFDFIDFWAIDFDYQDGQPFEHHWQDYRTRKDRSLKTVSDAKHKYEQPGRYTACVKVVDVFGCDTSVTVEVKV